MSHQLPDELKNVKPFPPIVPSSLAKQISDAKKVFDSWSPEKQKMMLQDLSILGRTR